RGRARVLAPKTVDAAHGHAGNIDTCAQARGEGALDAAAAQRASARGGKIVCTETPLWMR
ncbi:MAG: hypothetical protein RMJ55_15775, partial [Roseiflexaceae bacterium]|nr:hypothetical protein [Roseiflexaceae bacterium]